VGLQPLTLALTHTHTLILILILTPHPGRRGDERQDFGWYTCGLPGASALRYQMRCRIGGTLFISWMRSYTSNWGVVRVAVSAGGAARGEETPNVHHLLANATIDSRDLSRRNTFVETTSLQLTTDDGGSGGDKGAPGRNQHLGEAAVPVPVVVTLAPLPRSGIGGPSMAYLGPRMPKPVHEVDKRCPNKWKLVALACY